MNAQRAYVSKGGEAISGTPGLIVAEPHVGDPMQLVFDDGKILRTTAVKHISRNDNELVVDTQNSTYRLVYAA
jgi:hypothetical protein